MTENAEQNLLKSKHYLKINKIEYIELHPNTHFRVLIGRLTYSSKVGFIDLWPTTLKWFDSRNNIKGDGIDSFITRYKFLIEEFNISKPKIPYRSSGASEIDVEHKKYSREPEFVGAKNYSCFFRYKVHGGWIIRCSDGINFMPDKNHERVLEDEN